LELRITNYEYDIKMKRILLILTLILILYFQDITAQEKKWTLEDCISYAVTNNIGLQRQRLQTETAEVNFLKSKMDLLPSINLGSNTSIQYGRSVDPTNNTITFLQNLSNSYYAVSEINLFSGFTTLNTITANKYMLKAGVEEEKIAKNTLIINIMNQYYQVLYSKGLEEASKMQLDLSEKQLFRITKMVETGKEALSRQYEIQSQVSTDRLSYTIAHNTASQAVTTLKQMLRLGPASEFDIVIPDLNNILLTDSTYKPDSIYQIAANVLPRLKAIEFELVASKKQLAAARGKIAPSLTLGGEIYSGYYALINDTTSKASYSKQLNDNFGQYVYLTLNIPIFNNFTTARNIKLAKIKRSDTNLRLEQEKDNLYIDVENACLNFNRGKDEFAAAVANYDFNIKSFNAVEKKFESGLVDVTSYSLAKTTLFKADAEALRTKLQLLIRKLTIQFYATGEYQNIMK
jgi:outer membrane protein